MGLILWFFPTYQILDLDLDDQSRIKIQNELRLTLAHIMGGGLLIWGLYLGWRRVVIAQEGQITDRFSKAIEQLGSKKIEVWIGGILALERIAKDSNTKDYWTIMEVLTAFVRNNSRRIAQSIDQGRLTVGYQEKLFSDLKENEDNPAADIQIALTVIGRRAKSYGAGEPQKVDLSNSYLSNINLMGANLKGVDFTGSTLRCAKLNAAFLEGAEFYRADLEGANLSQAFLKGVSFVHANLQSVRLEGTKPDEACFLSANMTGAYLKRNYVILTDEGNFRKKHIEASDLSGAIGLNESQIESANIDENTKLPGYLKSHLDETQ